MKAIAFAAFAAIASFGIVSAAQAGTPSYSVTVASDYVNRGFSATDQKEAVQAQAEYSFDNKVYVGAWTSNVDFNDSTRAEVDLYAGYRPSYGKFDFDFGATYYGYVNQPAKSDYAYGELTAAVSHPVGKATVGAFVAYSPEFFGETGKAFYYEVNASYPLTNKLSVSAALGEQSFQNASYTTGNIGLTYQLTKTLEVDVRYHDTNTQYEPDHVVFALTNRF